MAFWRSQRFGGRCWNRPLVTGIKADVMNEWIKIGAPRNTVLACWDTGRTRVLLKSCIALGLHSRRHEPRSRRPVEHTAYTISRSLILNQSRIHKAHLRSSLLSRVCKWAPKAVPARVHRNNRPSLSAAVFNLCFPRDTKDGVLISSLWRWDGSWLRLVIVLLLRGILCSVSFRFTSRWSGVMFPSAYGRL